jgi:hypothetical protein
MYGPHTLLSRWSPYYTHTHTDTPNEHPRGQFDKTRKEQNGNTASDVVVPVDQGAVLSSCGLAI